MILKPNRTEILEVRIMKVYNNISTLMLQYTRSNNYNEFKRFFLEWI